MWADNETTVDLLGFDYLVDSLEVLLTEERLLPVTVGVAGDWGSGKTSLLYMAEDRLSRQDGFLCLHFSPWRYEGYEDVKAALMEAVVSKLREKVEADEDLGKKVGGTLKKLAYKVGLLKVAPAALTIASQTGHIPPEAAAAATTILGSLGPMFEGDTEEGNAISSIGDFRSELEDLMGQLTGVTALVVFVDDLDRCLPPTVIDTFEAIRLFLHAPKTAYVIAAHPSIIEGAIEDRYDAHSDAESSLGHDYLEKILQVTITVPALSNPEVETFINLLFAELHLVDDDIATIRGEARRRREEDQLAVAMNYGIAKDVLNDVPSKLSQDFDLANRIAPVLSGGLRGNPRQIKRFLNTFMLRLRTAAKRKVDLDPAVLAKLMILELNFKEYERLFNWQLAQDGQPQELIVAEAHAGGDEVEISGELSSWADRPSVKRWLLLEPPLAGVPLGKYFYFARDRLSPAAPASRLSAALQDLLGRLQSESSAIQTQAVSEAQQLQASDLADLFEALMDRCERDPRGRSMEGALQLATAQGALRPTFFEGLERIPVKAIPGSLALKLRVSFPAPDEHVESLFSRWGKEGSKELKDAISQATKS